MCPCVVSFLPLLPLPPLTLSTDVAPATKWNVLQLIDCSALHSIPITGTSSLLWLLLTSHSSLLLRLMRPPVRPPRLRCVLFPSMHLPHLLVLPTTFGLQCLLPPYPHFRALYAVPVRQVRGLLTASFRFHLTMDTLAVRLCTSSLSTRTRDFHPLENAHAGQTKPVYQMNSSSDTPVFILFHLLQDLRLIRLSFSHQDSRSCRKEHCRSPEDNRSIIAGLYRLIHRCTCICCLSCSSGLAALSCSIHRILSSGSCVSSGFSTS